MTPPSEENDDIEALAEPEAETVGEKVPDDQDQLAAEPEAEKAGEKVSDDQDQLAAEWEEMTSNTEATRVLNQDEIDSLLGADPQQKGSNDDTGLDAILNHGMVTNDRLPMLDVVFDRMMRLLSSSLRNFTSDNVEVALDNVSSMRFNDYIESLPAPAMLGVFKADEWENSGLVTLDSSLIFSTIDILLGGRRDSAPTKLDGRPFTTIERNLLEGMVRVVLNDLSSAFEPITPVNFSFERLETDPKFATIARPSNAVIVAKFRIEMEERGGLLDVLIPYATLEPVRELLLQMFMGEKFGRDAIWETHLANELWQTEVDLTAVLDEQTISLGKIFNLKKGSNLLLDVKSTSLVDIKCGNIKMFTGVMGRKAQNIAIKIQKKFSQEKN